MSYLITRCRKCGNHMDLSAHTWGPGYVCGYCPPAPILVGSGSRPLLPSTWRLVGGPGYIILRPDHD